VDVVLTIVFFLCAILAVAGAVGAALGPAAQWRLLGLLVLALGTAGVLASLSAGFAALVALVCLGASAVLLGSMDASAPARGGRRAAGDPVATPGGGRAALSAQVGAVAAAALLVLLLVVALGSTFVRGSHDGSAFDAVGLGRVFFGRDALALEAVGATLTAALAVGALARGRRS
jgi:NADH:ubiquinone oxidoreductase subunit 6 (subunit J)